ncbi:MAG: hypothetical protein IPP49_02160 [Saprospiraceae bacterium]|nr:hypothetical protein [Saprospiraceae bacterium]
MESSGLKPKSLIVLDLLSKGKSYAQISNEMDTSMDSVRYYIKDIYGVLGIKTKVLQSVCIFGAKSHSCKRK